MLRTAQPRLPRPGSGRSGSAAASLYIWRGIHSRHATGAKLHQLTPRLSTSSDVQNAQACRPTKAGLIPKPLWRDRRLSRPTRRSRSISWRRQPSVRRNVERDSCEVHTATDSETSRPGQAWISHNHAVSATGGDRRRTPRRMHTREVKVAPSSPSWARTSDPQLVDSAHRTMETC
jgi:hypothetical protein